jgi:hypothetical protein
MQLIVHAAYNNTVVMQLSRALQTQYATQPIDQVTAVSHFRLQISRCNIGIY